MLTLEGWNDVLAKEMEYSSWSWVYFVSFVLIGTFVVLNVVIAIIVNSMDEVRAMELERERTELVAAALGEGEADERMRDRLAALREAIDELERAIVDNRKGPAVASPSKRSARVCWFRRRRARRPRARAPARARRRAHRRPRRGGGPPTSSSTGT